MRAETVTFEFTVRFRQQPHVRAKEVAYACRPRWATSFTVNRIQPKRYVTLGTVCDLTVTYTNN